MRYFYLYNLDKGLKYFIADCLKLVFFFAFSLLSPKKVFLNFVRDVYIKLDSLYTICKACLKYIIILKIINDF